jgi:hypothetical protein
LLALLAAGFFGGAVNSLWALRQERAAGAPGHRLPVASQVNDDPFCWIFHLMVALAAPLLVLALIRKGLGFFSLVFPLALVGIGLQNAWLRCRRERALWVGVVAALWFLGFGVAAAGYSLFAPGWSGGWHEAAWSFGTLLIGLGAIVIGATDLRELARGTMVRQHGLLVFKAFVPWSRARRADWVRRGGDAFDLVVAFQAPPLLGRRRSQRTLRLVVPVPAGKRGDVEAFLAGRLGIDTYRSAAQAESISGTAAADQ